MPTAQTLKTTQGPASPAKKSRNAALRRASNPNSLKTTKPAPRATKPPLAPKAVKPKAATPKALPKTAAPARQAKAVKPPKKAPKAPKAQARMVRDSFTMPEADFALIATLKARALAGQREAKKSELLRAGLHALAALDGGALLAALGELEPVKIGRPKKGHGHA